MGRGLKAPKFLNGVAGKEQVTFFRGRGVAKRKKIKYEIFNGKKSL